MSLPSFLMKNMSGVRYEICWSPVHSDKFITWGTEIYLYQVAPLKDNKASSLKLSETSSANLLATNSNYHYVKCVDIYPQPDPDMLLAVGQANGKIVLTTFGPSSFDANGLAGKELAPRHARQCNAVAWNPVDSNLIVSGLDKYRADYSVLLWDVVKCPHHHGSAPPVADQPRPIAELGLSETTHSLAWFNSQARSLVLGMNNKHLKLVDLRDSSKTVNSTPTKAVYGLVVDHHNDCQMASYFENQIAVWDTRFFEKPILTLAQPRPVVKLLWCPTRHNLLGSLMRDSSAISLYHIQHTVVGNDEMEPSVLERSVQPDPANHVTSFSWHPTHENRLLTIAQSDLITDYEVFERMTLNWSSTSHIVWTSGRRTLKMLSDLDPVYADLEDVSVVMRRRALTNYGLKPELWQNGDLAEDPALKKLWHWLYLSQSLVEDGSVRCVSSRVPGVRCVLRLDGNMAGDLATPVCAAESVCARWTDLPPNATNTARIYKSEDRDKALQLCGWRFIKDSPTLTSFLERLEGDGAYSRAAAIAVFSLKLRLAIDILNRGYTLQSKQTEHSNLNIVAMALSGFSDNANSLWRELCLTARGKLVDPYLRAIFAFLTADSNLYENVLNEKGMAVEDRVAFACTFLSDVKLSEYLNQMTFALKEEGDPAGILLTGASKEGIDLLQRYLHLTGDVQSVALLSVRAFPESLHHDSTVKVWVEAYRTLLDTWRMWNQRAHFDITHSAGCPPSERPLQQVFVSCNFCGKSISAQMQGVNRSRGVFARLGATAQKLKMSSCPQCRKPLPRCAICLVHMGTPSGHQVNATSSNGRHTNTSDKLAEYATWFTWCQSCRHGGHASHMTQWFKEHSECPVTACTCCCLSKDVASKVKSVASSFKT